MADLTAGAPLPNSDTADGQNPTVQPTPSPVQGQARRDRRNRKNNPQPTPQTDGTVSDSVTNPTATPRSKREPNQRPSIASGTASAQTGNMGRVSGQKPRPVSLGGHMLPKTPAKEQAYAGPTFQASPAPSSLPVPKFFSKSVPNVADQSSLAARLEGETTPEKDQPSPESDVIDPVPRETQQSPLDLFFRADKAEKDRTRSAGHLSPQSAARPRQPATEPRNPFQQPSRHLFLQELGGDDGSMPSPRTVPQNGRPHAAERSRSSPGGVPQSPQSDEQRQAYTKSLKDLLFNNIGPPVALNSPQSSESQPQQRAQSDAQVFRTPP